MSTGSTRPLFHSRTLATLAALCVLMPLLAAAPNAGAQPDQGDQGKKNQPPGKPEVPGPPEDPPGLSRKPVPVPERGHSAPLRTLDIDLRGGARDNSVKGLKEAKGLRTERARFFRAGGGVHVAQLFAGPVNFKTPGGEWKRIDNSLVSEPGGFRNAANSFTVHFPQPYRSDDPVRLELEDGSLSFMLQGADSSTADPRSEAILYPDVLTDTDLKFQIHTSGYKEELILRNADAPSSFTYEVTAEDLTLAEGPNGMIEIRSDEAVVSFLAAPFAEDSDIHEKRGEGDRTYDVDLELTELLTGTYLLEVSVPEGWLNDPARVFPVRVDPDTFNNMQSVKDTFVQNNIKNTSQAGSDTLKVGSYDSDGWPRAFSYMRFAFDDLRDKGDFIWLAKLRAYNYHSWDGVKRDVKVKRITSGWSESVTWPDRPSVASEIADITSGCGDSQGCYPWHTWDVEGLIQDFFDNVHQNRGFRLHAPSPHPQSWKKYYSEDETISGADVGPYLELQINGIPAAPEFRTNSVGATFVEGMDDSEIPTITTTTPAIQVKNNLSDPNGDGVMLRYQVTDSLTNGTPDFSDPSYDSGWVKGTVKAIPAGALEDGKTYYARVKSSDGLIEAGKNSPESRTSAETRVFEISTNKLGTDPRWAMWTHSLGNDMALSVNQANGNLVLEYPLDSLKTPTGELDLHLSYNSQAKADNGLSPGWEIAAGPGSERRKLPARIRTLGDPSEPWAVIVVYRDGKRATFPEVAPRTYRGGLTGSDVIREHSDDAGWTLTTAAGSTYKFDANEHLIKAKPSTDSIDERGFDYVFDPDGRIDEVTDPLDRVVDFIYDDVTGRLALIRTWDNREWAFSYDSSGDLSGIADPNSDQVGFSYTSGKLSGIKDGQSVADAVTGDDAATRITYDSSSPVKVHEVTLPGHDEDGSAHEPYRFEYFGPFTAKVADTTWVTDPRGVASSDENDYKTITTFNTAGLPISIKGPAFDTDGDGTAEWPLTIKLWDGQGKLLCERGPAANAISAQFCTSTTSTVYNFDASEEETANTDPLAKLQTEYVYDDDPPHRLEKVVSPAPGDDGTGERLVQRYKSDEGFAGLQAFYYCNGKLEGVPVHTNLWNRVWADWGSGYPGHFDDPANEEECTNKADYFSMRWAGQLHADHASGKKKYALRFETEDGALLEVAGAQLALCWGSDEPLQRNCGEGKQEIELKPGWYPIVVESQQRLGDASVKLEWKGPNDSSWSVIPSSNLRPGLGTLTTYKEREADDPDYTGLTVRTYDFNTDSTRIRGLPDAETLSGVNTTDQTWSYTYDEYGRILTETDAAQNTITREYDLQAGVSCEDITTDRAGLSMERDCNAAGDVIEERVKVDDEGAGQIRTTEYSYDGLGRVTEVRHPDQADATQDHGRTQYDYDAAGRLIQEIVWSSPTTNRTTDYSYTPEGWLDVETLPDPDGTGPKERPTIDHDYDAVGNEARTTDERDEVWTATFDSHNRQTSETDPLGNTGSRVFDLQGRQVRSTTPSLINTVRDFDILGRMTSEGLEGLIPAEFAYDVQGNLTYEQDADGVAVTRTYEAAGKVASETRASDSQGADATRTFSYNGRGFLNEIVDEKAREREYGYDPEGRITSATLLHDPADSGPGTVTYTRNEAGELTGYTVPRANQSDITWSATYDQLGRLRTETDGVGNITTYRYNRAGELRQTDDPRGFTIDRSYDGMGREISVASSDGSVDQSFDYNRGSLMTVASNPSGDLTMSYLADGKLGTVSFGSWTTTLDYRTDRLVRRSDPGVTADFAYDVNGRMSVVAETLTPGNTDFTYTDAGRLRTRSEPSGLEHTFDYDEAGRFESDTAMAGTAEVARFTRAYNAASEVTSETRQVDGSTDNGNWDYTYDSAGRLKTATDPDDVTTTYDYDVAGNRTEVTEGTSTTTYNYNGAGRLTSSSDGATYDHDAAGNLTSITGGEAGDWSYTYDALSRTTSAAGGTQSITYALDALDRTVSRTSAGSTTSYFYQDLTEQPVQVSDPSGTTDIVWALGQPLVQQQGSATRFYGNTPHGDVAYLADTSGAIQGTRTYSPYGEIRSATGEESALGYQSDLTDPDTDLVDMGARQYHPGLGRFTSSDPLQGEPGTPLSMNVHLYGHADPMTNVDPTGLYVQGSQQGSRGYASNKERNKIQTHNQTTVTKRAEVRAADIVDARVKAPHVVPRPEPAATSARRATLAGFLDETFVFGVYAPRGSNQAWAEALIARRPEVNDESNPNPLAWASAALDAVYNFGKGERARSTRISALLRKRVSAAGRLLPKVGRATRYVVSKGFKVFGRVAAPVGAGLDFVDSFAGQGRGWMESAARTGLTAVGAVGGAAAGAGACGLGTLATSGAGAVACPALTVGGGAGGGAFGDWVGDQFFGRD